MDRPYRADIDGLRALAVVPVVLFHAGVPGFSGGFVGVDVFFVISGYLITGILNAEAGQGRLSIARFYERRARRIAPALIAVLLASVVAGYVLLFPAQYAAFAMSLLSTEVFASNIWFWRHTGYFAATGGVLPLLHTWSLAIEEQFYLVLPPIVALLGRHQAALRVTIVGLALTSFVLACIGVVLMPGAAFYLIPARAWELLVGSILALGVVPAPRHAVWRNILGGGGLLAVLVGIFGLSESSPFPGALALAPCLGAAAIILASTNGSTVVGRCLSWRPAVMVGLGSYSLYLWHWPIIAFTRQFVGGPLSVGEIVFCVVASFVAAAASWRWIEQPARDRSRLGGRRLLVGAGMAFILLGAAGAAIVATHGAPWRFGDDVLGLAAGAEDFSTLAKQCREDVDCHIGSVSDGSFIFAGDSHAGALSEAVAFAAGARGGVFNWLNSCPALVDWTPTARALLDRQRCSRRNARIFERLQSDDRIRTLILAGNWASYRNADPAALQTAVRRTAVFVQRLGKRLIILHGEPAPGVDLPWALAVAKVQGRPAPSIPFPAADGLDGIDLSSALCPQRRCLAVIDGAPLFVDANHVSRRADLRVIGPYLIRTWR